MKSRLLRLVPWIALCALALLAAAGLVMRARTAGGRSPQLVSFAAGLEGFDARADPPGELVSFLEDDPLYVRHGARSLGLRLRLGPTAGAHAELVRSLGGRTWLARRVAFAVHATDRTAGLMASIFVRSGKGGAEARSSAVALHEGWNSVAAMLGPGGLAPLDLADVQAFGLRFQAEEGRAIEGVLHVDDVEVELPAAPARREGAARAGAPVAVTVVPGLAGGRVPDELFGEELALDVGGDPAALSGLGPGPVRVPLFPILDPAQPWAAAQGSGPAQMERLLRGLRQAGRDPILVVGTVPDWLPAPDVVALARGEAQALRALGVAPARWELAPRAIPSGDDRAYWDAVGSAARAIRGEVPWARVGAGGWTAPSSALADLRLLGEAPLESVLYRHVLASKTTDGVAALSEVARFGGALETLRRGTGGRLALQAALVAPVELRENEVFLPLMGALWIEAARAGVPLFYPDVAGDPHAQEITALARGMGRLAAAPGRLWVRTSVDGSGIEAQAFRDTEGWELALLLVNPGEEDRRAELRVVSPVALSRARLALLRPGAAAWQEGPALALRGRADGSVHGSLDLPARSMAIVSARLEAPLPPAIVRPRPEVRPLRAPEPRADRWAASWVGAGPGAHLETTSNTLSVIAFDDCDTHRKPTDLMLFDNTHPALRDALRLSMRPGPDPATGWVASIVAFEDWRVHYVGGYRALVFAFKSDHPEADLAVSLAGDGERRGPQVRARDFTAWRESDTGWRVVSIPLEKLTSADFPPVARGVHFQLQAEASRPGEAIELRLDDVGFTD